MLGSKILVSTKGNDLNRSGGSLPTQLDDLLKKWTREHTCVVEAFQHHVLVKGSLQYNP